MKTSELSEPYSDEDESLQTPESTESQERDGENADATMNDAKTEGIDPEIEGGPRLPGNQMEGTAPRNPNAHFQSNENRERSQASTTENIAYLSLAELESPRSLKKRDSHETSATTSVTTGDIKAPRSPTRGQTQERAKKLSRLLSHAPTQDSSMEDSSAAPAPSLERQNPLRLSLPGAFRSGGSGIAVVDDDNSIQEIDDSSPYHVTARLVEQDEEQASPVAAFEDEIKVAVAEAPPDANRRNRRLLYLLAVVLSLAVAMAVILGVSLAKTDSSSPNVVHVFGRYWDQSTEFISLSNNTLSGIIPTELGLLTKLTRIDLGENRLEGSIPTEVMQCTDLSWLSLRVNKLKGTLPVELASLTKLTFLGLNHNFLDGTLLTELGALTRLSRLDVYGNFLNGEIPTELGMISQLTHANVGGNNLSGTIPSELGLWTSLEYISLAGNQLEGEIPVELGMWASSLTRLHLGRNMLDGSIPTELGLLTKLTLLFLGGNNKLAGSIPTELAELSNLTSLTLLNTKVSGTIPPSLCTASPLVDCGELVCGCCLDAQEEPCETASPTTADVTTSPPSVPIETVIPISGQEGDPFENLSTVTIFGQEWDPNRTTLMNLVNVSLVGTIPTQMGLLTQLTELSLATNELNETIPTELGLLASTLSRLSLGGNKLSGNIPTELGLLTKLSFLALRGNNLVGPLPTDFAGLTNLKWLALHSTQLSGVMPPSLCSHVSPVVDCGEIACTCCRLDVTETCP